MIIAGLLRHSVSIESLPDEPTLDAGGQPSDVWSLVANVRARIEPLDGRELLTAQQVNAEVTTRITIRWRALLTARNRVVHAYIFRGASVRVVYNVLYPHDPDNRHNELHLMCSSGLQA